jgi:LysR family nitrogen assimilation transcriptional regulator
MTLSQIHTFLVVSESLNFTKASKTLSVTQPAVSTQIQLLEKELGISLFNRLGRRVYLSQAGFLFRELALEIISRVDRSQTLLHSFSPLSKTETLRLGTGFGVRPDREKYLQHYLHGTFQKRVPIKAFQAGEELLVEELGKNLVDIVMFYRMDRSPRPFENIPGIQEIVVEKTNTLVLGSPGLPKDKWQRNLLLLESFPLLLPPKTTLLRTELDQRINSLKLNTKPGIETSDVDFIRKALLSGFGVGIFPASLFRSEIETGELLGLSLNEVSYPCSLCAYGQVNDEPHTLSIINVALQILGSGWTDDWTPGKNNP